MPSDPANPHEDGDDAHAAQLLISLPNTLSYAGSRVPPQVCGDPEQYVFKWEGKFCYLCVTEIKCSVICHHCLQMRCQANQNGSQVECDLGNPVKRDAKVRKQIGVNPVQAWYIQNDEIYSIEGFDS